MSGTVLFKVSNAAMRVAVQTANKNGATRSDLQVLTAVIAHLSGWCKLSDTIANSQIIDYGNIQGKTEDIQRHTIWRALRNLKNMGVLVVIPGANRHRAARIGYSEQVIETALALAQEPTQDGSSVSTPANAEPLHPGSSVSSPASSVSKPAVPGVPSVSSPAYLPRRTIHGSPKGTTAAAAAGAGGVVPDRCTREVDGDPCGGEVDQYSEGLGHCLKCGLVHDARPEPKRRRAS